MNNFLLRRLRKFLGDTALSVRDFETAIRHYDALYRMTKARFFTHSIATVEVATKLSYALLRTGKNKDLHRAIKLMEETQETASHLLEQDDPRVSEIDGVRGEIALHKREFQNARIHLQRAIEGLDATPDSSTVRLVELLELLETTCHQAGWIAQEQAIRQRINTIEQAQRSHYDTEAS